MTTVLVTGDAGSTGSCFVWHEQKDSLITKL